MLLAALVALFPPGSAFPAGAAEAPSAKASAGERLRPASPGAVADPGRLAPRAVRLAALREAGGFMGVPDERAFRLPVEATTGHPFTYNLLVVLVEFSDVHADRNAHPPSFYYHRLFQGTPGAPSLSDYYRANSGGRFKVTGLVTDWVRVDSTYASYHEIDPAAYPHNVQRLVEDVVAKLRDRYRWSDFDNDGDGLVDGLFLVHAGPGADETGLLDPADAGNIVAHEFHTSVEVPVAGARVFDYAVAAEAARPGVVDHEFGHLLGLIDLYYTGLYAGSAGPYGLGDWSLMGTGALLNDAASPANLDAWSRVRLGFVSPITINSTPGQVVSFEPGDDTVLKLWGAAGDREYFLVEGRHQTGFDAYLPGRGLLVYHVDDAVQTNSSATHFRVKVVQADGAEELDIYGGNRGDIGDPFPNVLDANPRGDLTSTSVPNTLSYTGTPSNVALYNIHRTSTGYQTEVVVSRTAEPRLVDFRIHEAEGNGNGRVERGETGSVDVTVRNQGAAITDGDLFMVFAPDESAALTGIDALGSVYRIGDLAPGETRPVPNAFTFRYRTDAPDSAGSYLFHTILACAQCGPEFRTDVMVFLGDIHPFADDFETGAPGWTHAAMRPAAPDPWHLSTERFRSAGHSFACSFDAPARNYDGGLDAALTSPVFVIPAGGRLSFWHSVDAETLATGRAWDGGLVEISVAGGEWRPLEPDGGYPFRLESGSGNPLFEQRAFSGHSAAFHRVTFDLAALAGATARVRFRFGSDSFADPAQLQRGWYIDDVTVTGGSPEIATTAALTANGVGVRWSLSADGGFTAFRVLRRADFPAAVPVVVAQVNATGGTLAYSAEDAPPPGRYVYEVEALDGDGPGPVSRAAALDVPERGASIRLAPPFPSPYHVSGAPATFEFFVPESGTGRRLTLDVIDVAGRLVTRLSDGPAVAGTTRISWTGDTAAGRIRSGIYYVRLSFGSGQAVRRLVVIS